MRKECPRCAERVMPKAQICRYCGFEFPKQIIENVSSDRLGAKIAAGVGLALVTGLGIAYFAIKELPSAVEPDSNDSVEEQGANAGPVEPKFPEIVVGTTYEWSADKASDEEIRSVGPYTVRITKKYDGEMVAPVLTISAGEQSLKIEGNFLSSGYTHSISAVRNRKRAQPVVMLQSFSGGAHCCNSVQLAGYSNGKLVRVDLGSWDGDNIGIPADISGDGTADFVFYDNSFLYAFAAYAMSYAPPKIYNVTNGKSIDVSARPAYRNLYKKSMEEAGQVCTTGDDGEVRNGACPAYVASAARLGRLNEAWGVMLASYDAGTDWEYPEGCLVDDSTGCPEGSVIRFKSYPESLLFFLKKQGYIPKAWQPPETRGQSQQDREDSTSDATTV